MLAFSRPIRPAIRANDPTFRADHPWAEPGHIAIELLRR
jgi:hypothetical protein